LLSVDSSDALIGAQSDKSMLSVIKINRDMYVFFIALFLRSELIECPPLGREKLRTVQNLESWSGQIRPLHDP